MLPGAVTVRCVQASVREPLSTNYQITNCHLHLQQLDPNLACSSCLVLLL